MTNNFDQGRIKKLIRKCITDQISLDKVSFPGISTYERDSLNSLQRCNCLWLLCGPTPVQPRHQDRETSTRVSQIVRKDKTRQGKPKNQTKSRLRHQRPREWNYILWNNINVGEKKSYRICQFTKTALLASLLVWSPLPLLAFVSNPPTV